MQAASLVAVTLTLTSLAVGCGGAGGPAQQAEPAATAPLTPPPQPAAPPPDTPPAAPPVAAQAAAPTRTPATEPVAPPPAAAPATAVSVPPLPVQDHEVAGVQVALVEARRTSGDTVTVKWQYRNVTGKAVKVSKGGTSWADAYQLTADAYLVDAVNKKKYLVIRDAQNYWIASKHGDWQGVMLEPNQTLNAWAKFPAPAAAVDSIAVNIPGTAPFEDVPIVK